MRYPSAEELRAMPLRQSLARLEDRMMSQLLAAKASEADAGSPEAQAAIVSLLLSMAAREAVAAGDHFDEAAFVEAARAAAQWAAHRASAFADACERAEAPCETH